jgi:hypothetical protein
MKHGFRALVLLAFATTAADAQVIITLKDSFIKEFENRATITANYTVVHTHHKPNRPKDDGDIHAAGFAPEIGLNTVAEIMNAAQEKPAMNAIIAAEGTDKTVKITGAWRLWPEHAGGDPQVQDFSKDRTDEITNTNPDHVFQIHPIASVNAIDVRNGFHPIAGFTPKDAENAFTRYENIRCKLSHNDADQTTTIRTNMTGFNYVKFRMDLLDVPQAFRAGDGSVAFASVSTVDGDLLARKRRMIFLKGTPPEKAAMKLKKGGHLIVLGIPRIDLALVDFRIQNANKNPDDLDWNLPYEIVVVGVFTEE